MKLELHELKTRFFEDGKKMPSSGRFKPSKKAELGKSRG